MAIELNEDAIRKKFAHYMDDPSVVQGLAEMLSDPFLLAFFLMSVSEGEAMGEAGVAAIREEEIAKLIDDIERQQREEGGHKHLSLDLAREFFPEYFDDGEYLYRDKLTGRDYYLAVLQDNRARLKDRGAWQIGDGSEEVIKLLIARSRFGREIFDLPMRHANNETR